MCQGRRQEPAIVAGRREVHLDRRREEWAVPWAIRKRHYCVVDELGQPLFKPGAAITGQAVRDEAEVVAFPEPNGLSLRTIAATPRLKGSSSRDDTHPRPD
jgi:hypothetical protein